MAQGRGSAKQIIVLGFVFFGLFLGSEMVDGATYRVGDAAGWSFSSGSWPRGKTFRAGDILIFQYSPILHNLVIVDGASYTSCRTPRGARVSRSGNDRIVLKKGLSYFICNVPGHCQAGMKIAINAL